MDYQIFSLINGLASQNPILDTAGIFFAQIAIVAIVALSIFAIVKKGKTFIMGAILTLVVILVIDSLINSLLPTPRPFIQKPSVNLLIAPPNDPSFPSNHASIATAAATFIFYYSKVLGSIFFVLAVLVAASRIFVGVHYPVDVVGGFLIGLITSIIAVKLLEQFTRISCYRHSDKQKR